jgi:hypothetical protein
MIAELCLRRILTFFSKNLTKGFAIIATIHPITNGIKKLSTLGSKRNINKTTAIAHKRLITILI